MSGFGFSFGNTPATTTASSTTNTFSSFGQAATNQQTFLPSFGSTAASTGFGTTMNAPATSTFGATTTTGNLLTSNASAPASSFNFNLGTLGQAATNQQTFLPTFGSTAASTGFGKNTPATSTFGATTTTGNLLTSNASAPTSSFNFNLGSTNTTTQQPQTTTTSTFSLIPTTQQNQSLLGAQNSTTQSTTNQTNSLLGSTTQTTQSNALNTSAAANKTTGGAFQLNFNTPQSTSTTVTTSKTSLTTSTPQVTSSSLPLTTQSTTASTNQQQTPTQMTFKQLEGYINVWLNELNQMESDFQTQSQTINSWDSLLVNNALKITNVNENLDVLKEEHKRIDQQLDFVISQQNELEQLLEPLEKIQIDFNVNDTASTEREFTYSLVDTVSNDLQSIGAELQNFIKKLNETKSNQDLNDPLSPIGKILNSHLDALQYIEHQISVLKRNIEA